MPAAELLDLRRDLTRMVVLCVLNIQEARFLPEARSV